VGPGSRSHSRANLDTKNVPVRLAPEARPRTRKGWLEFLATQIDLTAGERRALEVVYVEGVTTVGAFRGFGWAAKQLGLTRAGFMYRWKRAEFKLGWAGQTPARRPTISRATRVALVEEATHGGVCPICGRAIVSVLGLVLDHIVPYAAGGPTTRENLRAVHLLCNRTRELLPYLAPEHHEWSPLSGRMLKANARRSLEFGSRDVPVPPGLRPPAHLERRVRSEQYMAAAFRRGAGRAHGIDVASTLSLLAIANGASSAASERPRLRAVRRR